MGRLYVRQFEFLSRDDEDEEIGEKSVVSRAKSESVRVSCLLLGLREWGGEGAFSRRAEPRSQLPADSRVGVGAGFQGSGLGEGGRRPMMASQES